MRLPLELQIEWATTFPLDDRELSDWWCARASLDGGRVPSCCPDPPGTPPKGVASSRSVPVCYDSNRTYVLIAAKTEGYPWPGRGTRPAYM